jgi:hypothetical protein
MIVPDGNICSPSILDSHVHLPVKIGGDGGATGIATTHHSRSKPSKTYALNGSMGILSYKNLDVANLCLQNDPGEAALVGNEEYIELWSFDAAEEDRTIWFKGYFIAIYNETTMDVKKQVVNSPVTTEYTSYDIPAGYICQVRQANAYFEI